MSLGYRPHAACFVPQGQTPRWLSGKLSASTAVDRGSSSSSSSSSSFSSSPPPPPSPSSSSPSFPSPPSSSLIFFSSSAFFFFFFCVPQLDRWSSPFWVRLFAYERGFFFNPTIEAVTFRLRGWCMLGVFLLPAFTRLGHEYQDLLSLCDGMLVGTD